MLLRLHLLGLLREIFLLHHLKSSVIFCCSTQNCVNIAKLLQEEKLLTSAFNLNSTKDFALIQKSLSHNIARIGVIIDLDCKRSFEMLRRFSETNKFNETFIWFVYSSATTIKSFDVLSKLNIQWDSEVFLVNSDGQEKLTVYEVFKIKRNVSYPLTMNLMGLWDGKNFSISKEFSRSTKIRRRLDFYGSEIYGAVSIVSIHSGYTVMDMLQKRIDTTTAGSAFQYSILQTIVDRINATLVLRRISTWSQFSRLPNESLSGTIGLLNSSLADVSVTPLSITADRLPYATPTATTWRAQFGFVFRHPKSTSLRAIYLQPFTNILWIATLIVLVLYWMVFIVALRFYPDPEGAPGSAFLGIFGAFLQQGYSEKLLPFSGRILLVFGFIFSLVCYQFYSTFIVGSLIVDSPKNIRTIHDLAASKLLIGANPVPYNDYLFNSTSKILSSLYADRIKKPGNFFPPDIGIQMIQKGGFAYHFDVETMYETIVQNFSEDEICDLQEIISWKALEASAVVGKNSPYRELINVLTRQLTESGVIQHEHTKWFTLCPKCYTSRVTVVPVDIEKVFTPMMIISVGLVVSVIILTIEIYIKKRQTKMIVKNVKQLLYRK